MIAEHESIVEAIIPIQVVNQQSKFMLFSSQFSDNRFFRF